MRDLVRCVVYAVLLLGSLAYGQTSDNGSSTTGSSISGKPVPTTTSSRSTNSAITPTFDNGTCPSRTANYITHTLPQQCLRTDRSSSTSNFTVTDGNKTGYSTAPLASSEIESNTDTNADHMTSQPDTSRGTVSTEASTVSPSSSTGSGTIIASEEESDSPLDNANFLSFEEWKKQNQPKVDSDQGRNQPLNGERQRPINNALESFGDEGEIDIDFSGFGGSSTQSGPRQPQAAYRQQDGSSASQDVPTSQTVRTKDAGKTCKERTNYASFDCAAQVLKNNPECKSPSSVLVENKDSYMLNTCSAQNKFFIVELCNDILIDTVVLANYEFFSSSFRHFRVSVSTRYPVKMDKWIELGTFEAKNTREIQAFLVEHPKIWARYLRVEFLSHYGSEYYCPVSLLRVHGINMLEDLGQHESGEGDSVEDEVALGTQADAKVIAPEEPSLITAEIVKTETSQVPTEDTVSSADSEATQSGDTSRATNSGSVETSLPLPTSSASVQSQNATQMSGFEGPVMSETTCLSNISSMTVDASTMLKETSSTVSEQTSSSVSTTAVSSSRAAASKSSTPASNSDSSASSPIGTSERSNTTAVNVADEGRQNTTATGGSNEAKSAEATNSTSTSANTEVSHWKSPTSTSRIGSATSLSQVAQPQPSTQESFFKLISKRLQQLESNSTLSLQYIEEQSRILRDAFSKVEKRQIASTSAFLTNLNETVLKELHGFRQAYDQLWQSTVLELEGQREQYQREMLALSSRLTLVADELLWQKRMGIVQSTLLLLCLGLVLFARTGVQGYLEVPLMQQAINKSSAALSRAGWESPPASPSPQNRSPVTLFRRKLWRSVTEPGAVGSREGTDGDITGTDSRPDTRDGANPDVFVEPPTPPPSRGQDSEVVEMYDNADADDEEDVFDPRESQSGPSTPTGTRETSDRASGMVNGVIEDGVG